ncbi:MAG: AI-2E family transporter [bacterium]|nr:AI-2E family transporter [bacterium]
MESARAQHYFFLGLLIIALALNALIFLPYVGTLVFAATLAVVFAPVYERVARAIPKAPSVATLLTMAAVLVVIVLPASFFGTLVFEQAQDLYVRFADEESGLSATQGLLQELGSMLPFQVSEKLIPNVGQYAREALSYIVGNLGKIFSGVATAGLNALLAIFALFFFLRDGGRMKDALVRLSPLRDSDDQRIATHLGNAVNAVIKGALLISLAQGVVAGIGYALFGVPNAALWGAATVFTSFIPGIGTAAVLVPSVMYLWNIGNVGAAIGLIVWGVLVVGLMDNVLKPKLIAKGVGVHPFLILLSVLGGLHIFGIYGFLLGPLLLALLVALLELYAAGVAPHTD